jgi:hypothetical protein
LGFHLAAGLFACALTFAATPALAQYGYDTLTVAPSTIGRVGIMFDITAGATGAPGGFSVWWMKLSDYVANGYSWYYFSDPPQQLEGSFTGTPTLNTTGGTVTTFALAPYQTATIEIGDLFDETGVTTSSATASAELEPGVQYVICAYANAHGAESQSDLSTTYGETTDPPDNCIFSQGWWKNHPSSWPVASLTLGSVSYTQTELLSILNTPASGNGLISLAHQLIAAKLNIAGGASGAPVASTIVSADAQIGALVVPPIGSGFLAPSSTTASTQTLDDYNNGEFGSNLCGDTPTRTTTWGQVKSLYR